MRLSHPMIFACALVAAAPALAQDNVAASGNTVATNAVDTNLAAPVAPTDMTTNTVTPADQSALGTTETLTTSSTATTTAPPAKRGFPWGVLGLLGLVGLLGVRKVST